VNIPHPPMVNIAEIVTPHPPMVNIMVNIPHPPIW
jgi:hypothetical protein